MSSIKVFFDRYSFDFFLYLVLATLFSFFVSLFVGFVPGLSAVFTSQLQLLFYPSLVMFVIFTVIYWGVFPALKKALDLMLNDDPQQQHVAESVMLTDSKYANGAQGIDSNLSIRRSYDLPTINTIKAPTATHQDNSNQRLMAIFKTFKEKLNGNKYTISFKPPQQDKSVLATMARIIPFSSKGKTEFSFLIKPLEELKAKLLEIAKNISSITELVESKIQYIIDDYIKKGKDFDYLMQEITSVFILFSAGYYKIFSDKQSNLFSFINMRDEMDSARYTILYYILHNKDNNEEMNASRIESIQNNGMPILKCCVDWLHDIIIVHNEGSEVTRFQYESSNATFNPEKRKSHQLEIDLNNTITESDQSNTETTDNTLNQTKINNSNATQHANTTTLDTQNTIH